MRKILLLAILAMAATTLVFAPVAMAESASASASASASPTAATAQYDQYKTATASPLPQTGGPISVIALVPLALLVISSILAFRVIRRT